MRYTVEPIVDGFRERGMRGRLCEFYSPASDDGPATACAVGTMFLLAGKTPAEIQTYTNMRGFVREAFGDEYQRSEIVAITTGFDSGDQDWRRWPAGSNAQFGRDVYAALREADLLY